MTEMDQFYVHTVTVQTYLGSGARGDTFAAAVTVPCFVDDTQDVTVGGTTVAVTDQTKIYAPLATYTTFATNSKVTVNGQATRIVSVKRHSSGALGLPDHVEVSVK